MIESQAAAVDQGMLFQRLRWRLWWNTLRVFLRRNPVRFLTIFLCSVLVWGSLFALSYMGFRELKVRWNLEISWDLIGFVLDLMFVSLTVLLVFSTGIILYSSLFSSAETSFLLSSPVGADQVFAYKFQSAVAFSSWAFVLLGSPILLSYGIWVGDGGAPWYFYAVLPLFFLGFVLLPGSLGALLCFAIVNFVPRHHRQLFRLALVVVAALLAVRVYFWFKERQELLGSRDWFEQFFGMLTILQRPFVPTHWIAGGLVAAARAEPDLMLYYLCLIWSNGLALYVFTAWVAHKLYRRGFNRVVTGGTLRRRYGGGWLDAALGRMLFFLAPQTRLLIIKDFRSFRRDPAQWAQILIFLGLAVLYFSNIRRFYEQDIGKPFQNGISLLNLTATAFLMCAYTGRFIFPMLSLEGRKFWILGLLPLERDRLLWGKFAFATTGALLVSEFLVVFSNWMLNMPWSIIAVHAVTIVVLSIGLSGLSVGLGACLPNFRESDPSKIAVGFGGTLNLVAGLLLLIVVIGLMAGPWHLLQATGDHGGVLNNGSGGATPWPAPWWVWASSAAGALVGLAAGVLPMRAGVRALHATEF
jgi:ABC-2 type transport system permease protein